METQEHLLNGDKQGKPAGDQSFVEELLDFFSCEMENDAATASDNDGGSDAARGNFCTDSFTITAADSSNNSFSGGSDTRSSGELIGRSFADAGLSGDLCEPYADLAELEWLSNFVEESFSTEELHKQQLLSGIKTTSSQPVHQPDSPFAAGNDDSPPFTREAPLPGKARSRRARTAPCSWSSRPLILAPSTESSSSENSDAPITQPHPVKKLSKKELSLASLVPALDGRKCQHCATDKTPQWRAGPMGPKTLCNACGVRFKTGRLLPEYRPAASPTFSVSMHSNSHKKVLELRLQKESHCPQFMPAYDNAVASAEVAAATEDELLIQRQFRPDFRPVF